jgi:predicted transcriptional regulator
MQTRKVVIIQKPELKKLNTHFSLFGTRTDFMRKTKIPRSSLNRILEAGMGEERIVKKIRSYAAN